MLDPLLRLSRAIDWVNDQFGRIATWTVLIATLISAGNAVSRYMFSASSNAWLENSLALRIWPENAAVSACQI